MSDSETDRRREKLKYVDRLYALEPLTLRLGRHSRAGGNPQTRGGWLRMRPMFGGCKSCGAWPPCDALDSRLRGNDGVLEG